MDDRADTSFRQWVSSPWPTMATVLVNVGVLMLLWLFFCWRLLTPAPGFGIFRQQERIASVMRFALLMLVRCCRS